MVRVKICGLTREEDIRTANRIHPDMAGFVFAESRRQVTPEQARALMAGLDPAICRVGVFVNAGDEALTAAARAGLHVLQLHGDETPERVMAVRHMLDREGLEDIRLWKAVRVRDSGVLDGLGVFPVDALLLDSYHPGSYGGTGLTFDWKLAAGLERTHKVIIAGGLTPENVGNMLETLLPWGVDVSGGVETEGIKDPGKVAAFVAAVRTLAY